MKYETRQIARSTATMVGPTGVDASKETRIPKKEPATPKAAEHSTVDRKLRQKRIADRAGKMISAEIKRDPTRFMARTMITAVTTAISKWYREVRMPMARAKSSSKVTAKIL